MKKLKRLTCLFFVLTLIVTSMAGCQKKVSQAECPFTTIRWGATLEDIVTLEGESTETYASSYKGTTYTYQKEFNDLDGIVKYMFDDKEKLVGMAWTYVSDDAEDIKAVYEKLHGGIEKTLGKSGFDFGGKQEELNTKLENNQEALNAAGISSPLVDVWYLKGGNVMINAIITNEVKAVQYTYLHPDVSQENPDK